MLALFAVGVVIAAVAGSGGHSKHVPTSSNQQVTPRDLNPNAPLQRTLAAGRRYCSSYGVKALALQYHTAADPIAVADAYAQDFGGEEHPFAVQGCLDGLGH